MRKSSLTIFLCFLLCVAFARQNAPPADCCSFVKQIDGFMIDLDGTMYNSFGLIDGAQDFFNWLNESSTPFVFLSDTSSKGKAGVQSKFLTPPFRISDQPIGFDHIFTASVAVSQYLQDNAPKGSNIYILQSTSQYGKVHDSCVSVLKSQVAPQLFSTWNWRTDLNMNEITEWAYNATRKKTFVVICADGDVFDDTDPITGKQGYSTWTFSLLTKATVLIQNGATLVVAAPDTHILTSPNAAYPNVNLNSPGPGTFQALLNSSTYPDNIGRIFDVGKGGNLGTHYMVDAGLQLLQQQGDISQFAIVGDTLDTDIKAAALANGNGFFVLSGVHTRDDISYYPFSPTCIFSSVGEIARCAKSP